MDSSQIDALKTAYKQVANDRVQKWESLGDEGMIVRAKADAVTGFGMLCSALDAVQLAAAAPVAAQEIADLLPDTYQTAQGLREWAAASQVADDEWRRLALQFDGHRMQAIGHLRALMQDPLAHRPVVAAFLAAPPLPGESVLAERIKALAAAETTTLLR